MQVTVLGVQKWTLDNDGKPLSGITVHYFDPADNEVEPDRIGIFPASITAKPELISSFTDLPAKYNFNLGLKRGTGGKSKPVLKSVQKLEK